MIAQAVNMPESPPYHFTIEQIRAEEVIIRAACADNRKFEPLYRSYYPRIIAFVYQRVDDHEAAHEITSQVFYSALENLHKYKPSGVPFGAWLFRIALNKLNGMYRKSKVQRTINIDTEGLQHLTGEMHERDEAAIDKRLFEALQSLEPGELELVDMRFFENRPFKEICEILGIGESACKMRLYRILEKLKNKLKTQGQ
jgi:RNA polymerase sigma-70 factor, ECF subfamily